MKTKHTLLVILMALCSVAWAKKDDVETMSFKKRLTADSAVFKLEEITKRAEYGRGGAAAMNKFLTDNVVYPESLYGKNVKGGRVVADFIIEKDGSVSNIMITKSIRKEFDDEVVKVISKMPKWKPAEVYYKNETYKVRTQQQVSVEFK